MLALICDNNKEFAYKIMKEFHKYTQIPYEFQYVSDGIGFYNYLENKKSPDLIFMDITSGTSPEDENGIALIKRSERFIRNSLVVFLSENSDHMTDVYDVPHLAHIRKDELSARALWLSRKLVAMQKHKNLLLLESGKKKTMLPTDQILYLERERRSTYIYTTDGIFRSSEKLVDLHKQLDQKMFVRCHNSYIANLDAVVAYHRTEFLMEEERKIPISRSHQKEMKKRLDDWLLEQ